MLRKLTAVLTLSLAAFTAASSPASASSQGIQPPGSYTVGVAGICLTAQNGNDTAGTPVVLAPCQPNWHRDQWSFNNGQLSPWGDSTVVSVSPDGFLLLAGPGATGSIWTYGPGHELTTELPSGPAFLTWVAGHGRQPWADTMAGPGQVFYMFGL